MIIITIGILFWKRERLCMLAEKKGLCIRQGNLRFLGVFGLGILSHIGDVEAA